MTLIFFRDINIHETLFKNANFKKSVKKMILYLLAYP